MARIPDTDNRDYCITDNMYRAVQWLKEHYFVLAREFDNGYLITRRRGYDPVAENGVYLLTTRRDSDQFLVRTLTDWENLKEFRFVREWTALGVLVEQTMGVTGFKRPIERARAGASRFAVRDLPYVVRTPNVTAYVDTDVDEAPTDLI